MGDDKRDAVCSVQICQSTRNRMIQTQLQAKIMAVPVLHEPHFKTPPDIGSPYPCQTFAACVKRQISESFCYMYKWAVRERYLFLKYLTPALYRENRYVF